MSKLLELVNKQMIVLSKTKNLVPLNALRMLKAKAQRIAMDDKKRDNTVTEQDMTSALNSCVKQTQEEIDIYVKNNREEQAAKARQENELYKSYLPKQLNEEEITSIVNKIISDLNATSIKDMGKVMIAARSEIGSQAEARIISKIVKERLS